MFKGTFPFQAAELLQPKVHVSHKLNHDLEAFFWVIWIICVNIDGPFDRRREWKPPPPSRSRGSVSRLKPAAPKPSGTVENDPWEDQVHVPMWARPGIHNLDGASVSAGKTDIGSAGIGASLSPYFSKHEAVVEGLIKMHLLFQWRAAGGIGPRVLPPADTDYLQMINILREIRDAVDPVSDGRPSDEAYAEGKIRYEELLKAGCVDNPVLGNGDSMATPTPSASCSRSRKRPAEKPAEGTRGSKRSLRS